MSDEAGKRYVVAGNKPWNRALFREVLCTYPGEWHFAATREELTPEAIAAIGPRYLFFLHWSDRVPLEIIERYECVCFHMTDVPYGRGGSPLQNLIVGGLRETKLTALRMTQEFDAGPVYMKAPLSLEGGAEEIYLRAGRLSAEMIERIIRLEPKPAPQKGKVVNFKRRKPEQSELGSPESAPASLEEFHDFIRMLDAEGYPRAFLNHAGFRFEFSRPALYDGRIVADVTITRATGKEKAK